MVNARNTFLMALFSSKLICYLGFFSYLTMFLKDQHWGQEESKLPILNIMNSSCHLSWLYPPFIVIQEELGRLGINPGLATYLRDFSYINYLSEPHFLHLLKDDW